MRVYIVGTSGSGKSSLAKELSKRYNIKHIELDSLNFLPGWVERPDEDFEADVEKAIEADNWVICGNYRNVQPMIMAKADKIVWLNYPFAKVFWRTIKRTLRRLINKEQCCGGNYETIYRQFCTKYSIFLWVINTYAKKKNQYNSLREQPGVREKWVTINNNDQLNDFLKKLP